MGERPPAVGPRGVRGRRRGAARQAFAARARGASTWRRSARSARPPSARGSKRPFRPRLANWIDDSVPRGARRRRGVDRNDLERVVRFDDLLVRAREPPRRSRSLGTESAVDRPSAMGDASRARRVADARSIGAGRGSSAGIHVTRRCCGIASDDAWNVVDAAYGAVAVAGHVAAARAITGDRAAVLNIDDTSFRAGAEDGAPRGFAEVFAFGGFGTPHHAADVRALATAAARCRTITAATDARGAPGGIRDRIGSASIIGAPVIAACAEHGGKGERGQHVLRRIHGAGHNIQRDPRPGHRAPRDPQRASARNQAERRLASASSRRSVRSAAEVTDRTCRTCSDWGDDGSAGGGGSPTTSFRGGGGCECEVARRGTGGKLLPALLVLIAIRRRRRSEGLRTPS